MSKRSRHDEDDDRDYRMNVEFDTVSVNSGNVIISGRDATITVHTGGDVEQHGTQTITVGGVETSPEALEKMIAAIRAVDKTIVDANLDEDTTEAALDDLQDIEKQLTSSKKPNPVILVRAAKSLLRISPMLASGVVALFGEPLAAQIIAGVGGVAVQFYNTLMQRKSKG